MLLDGRLAPLAGRVMLLLGDVPARWLAAGTGFWSLTLYNKHHFFHPDELNRYSFGPKNKNLHRAGDGSLTLTSSATPPADQELRANRLPAPAGHLAAGNGRRDGADERSE